MDNTVEISDDVLTELFTVNDWVRFCASHFNRSDLFYGHGTDNPWDEAAQVVMWVIATPWERLPQVGDCRLAITERKRLLSLLRRRINERIPLPYLTGEAYFAGMRFIVNESVLIPRSPVAELVKNQFSPWLANPPMQILDLCTGSGCIGIACAEAFEEAEVYLSDISEAALQVAEINVDLHQLGDRVGVIQSDLFQSIPGQFDLIVTNPPYVDEEDMSDLPAEYKVEPALALESGHDGLDFTRRLLREAADHLSNEGILVAEVGNSYIALEETYPELPFTWVEFENGGHGVFVLTKAELTEYNARFSD